MSITVHDDEKETNMNRVASTRLYLTADKSRVVTEDDPAARILLAAGAGDEIPAEYADLDIDPRFLQDDTAPAADGDEAGTPEGDVIKPKAAAKPANKAVKKTANK